MIRSRVSFLASSATACLGLVANALPYLLTRKAFQRDGQEIAGFPFVFHRVGGDCFPAHCGTFQFALGPFLVDLAILVLAAYMAGAWAGWAATRRRRRTR